MALWNGSIQTPLLEGELWSSAEPEESYFELEDEARREDEADEASGTCRYLVVYLAKQRVETWEEVLKPELEALRGTLLFSCGCAFLRSTPQLTPLTAQIGTIFWLWLLAWCPEHLCGRT